MTPTFMQSLPKGPVWTLLTPSKRAGTLLYRDDVTGQEVRVPSVWYNQPIEWRADYLISCAERSEASARRLRTGASDPWILLQADGMERDAVRLRMEAREMRDSGKHPAGVRTQEVQQP